MSNRDKKLLVYLGTVLILAAAYYLVVSPVLSKIEVMNNHISDLEQQLNRLQTIFNSREQYEADIVENQAKCNELIARFPSNISQEDTLVFIDSTEKEIPVKITNISFGDIVTAFGTESSGDAVYEDSPEEEYSEEVTDTTAMETDENGVKMISFEDLTRLIGTKQELTLAYEVSYSNFAKFIQFIDTNDKRMVLTNINGSYNDSLDLVYGVVNLSQYSIEKYGKDRDKNDFSDINKGTGNVFHSGTAPKNYNNENAAAGANSGSTANVYMSISRVNDNGGAVIICNPNQAGRGTWATGNENEKMVADITIDGEAGEYTAEYSIDGKTNSFEFEEDSEIIVDISSSAKTDDDDNVTVDLNVTNNADLDMTVNINGDSDERVNVRTKKANGDGKLTINQ